MKSDVLLLMLRNAIANKEFAIASANSDLARYGEWQCNWSEFFDEASREITKLSDELAAKND